MTPEWEELKNWMGASGIANLESREIYHKMQEIERRTLAERVARILRNLDWHNWPYSRYNAEATFGPIAQQLAQALESGDTTRIEEWCKK